MKKSIGVIAEYNPFHNGHLLHLTEARRLAGGDLPVIAVMSGSVVQRGEPAFCNKWARAQMAVQNGVDLVLELPAVFSCRSAEFFAAGAVQLLAATGITDYLAFGAETAETQTLAAAAHFINTHQEELRAIIKAARLTLQPNPHFCKMQALLLPRRKQTIFWRLNTAAACKNTHRKLCRLLYAAAVQATTAAT